MSLKKKIVNRRKSGNRRKRIIGSLAIFLRNSLCIIVKCVPSTYCPPSPFQQNLNLISKVPVFLALKRSVSAAWYVDGMRLTIGYRMYRRNFAKVAVPFSRKAVK